ncbi:MAG: hypothetical protein JSW06_02950 [Thermoplasmatales archaeon]|nr:MAG: hypothetical protein JSW06_02950 [Thermoplasmatales archaeon]
MKVLSLLKNKGRFFIAFVVRRCEESDCVCYWFERGMEDCDEGCCIGKLECGYLLHCYYPKFIKTIVKKYLFKKEERYWEKMGKKYYS